MFAETAGGVTVAGLEQAVRRGLIGPDDEVVALITGNGVKTPDAKWFGVEAGSNVGRGGLAAPIEPSYSAFTRTGLAA